MTVNFEQVLDKQAQSALADEIVATAAVVISNASAPDFAAQTLQQHRQDTLAPEQRAAAAAMQAYGMRCAGEVFTSALDQSAVERAETLQAALENECPDDALALLDRDASAGAEFKSRMCRAIAAKCAELVAAEIDRIKKGPINIHNEDDRQVFERLHEERQKARTDAFVAFLSALPSRYPSFGTELFAAIRQDVQQDITEKFKSPDIHAAVAGMFNDALDAMPPETRTAVTGSPS